MIVNVDNIDDLKIWSIMESLDYEFTTPEGITKTDFSVFLHKTEPDLVKGKRTYRDWMNPEDTDDLVLKVNYLDVVDENNSLIRIDKQFVYYKLDGTVGISIDKPYKVGFRTCEFEQEKRRRIQLSDLKSRAKKLGFSTYIDILYTYLKDEINDYYETNSTMLANELTATKNLDLSTIPSEQATYVGQIQAILNSVIGTDGVSTFDAIMYEIS